MNKTWNQHPTTPEQKSLFEAGYRVKRDDTRKIFALSPEGSQVYSGYNVDEAWTACQNHQAPPVIAEMPQADEPHVSAQGLETALRIVLRLAVPLKEVDEIHLLGFMLRKNTIGDYAVWTPDGEVHGTGSGFIGGIAEMLRYIGETDASD